MLGRVVTEDAADLLGAALKLFADAVSQSGGEVLRFTGDGVKAVFGLQGLREDEAERAVRAGLQILQDAARHAERVRLELGVADFGVRVGIHTGPVLLGDGPEAEKAAMGHAVHLAARMEQSAPVGQLRVSDATWAQVRGLFIADAQPPLWVKGHDEPLRTWLVRGVQAGPEPTVARGVEGLATPTIGRDDELARLAALHAHSVATGSVSMALVLADAGVGKTRLRQELLQRLHLREGDAGLLQARAQPSSGLQPYGLLRQLLARWLLINDDLPAADARQRLVDGLAPWLGAQAALQTASQAPHFAQLIGQLIGMDFSQHPAVQALGASGLRERAFAALRAALLARAAHTPLLLVLDDLHWADDASLSFVQTLLQPAEVPTQRPTQKPTQQPLMLLLLARPALHERGVTLQAPDGMQSSTLHLQPLDATHGLALAQALLQPLPKVPDSLLALLLQRAEGNPFFLEALVRMLIDDGVIDARTRPWQLQTQRLEGLRVPATLVGVLQARLDALSAGDLLALQMASVVGAVFWNAALQAVDARAPAALPQLQQRTLVVERDRSAFADTSEQAFAHALLHEVTYGTVLKAPRRAGHAAVARWLTERVSDRANEFLAVTAEHFERAGDSAQALEYWDRAQSDASRRYANEASLHFVQRALAQAALTDARWRYTLLANQHEVLERMGRIDDAARIRQQMSGWAERCDDNAMRADVLVARMLVADHAGRPEEARRLAEEALVLAHQADAAVGGAAALAHGELAWLASQQHDHATVAAQVEAGMARARVSARTPRRQMGYGGYEAQLRAIAIESLQQQDRYADVLAAVAQGLDTDTDTHKGTAQDRFNLLSRRAPAERQLGRLAEAAATAAQVLALADQTGMPRLRLFGLMQVAESALWADDLDRTEACLLDAAVLAATVQGSFYLPAVREQQGQLALRRGDQKAARAGWLESRALFSAQERPSRAVTVGCQLALLDLAQGDAAAARAAVDVALAAAAEHGRPRRRALPASALLACHQVLAASLTDESTDSPVSSLMASLRSDLLVRLDEQLAALADAAARNQLLRNVPHWRAAQALR